MQKETEEISTLFEIQDLGALETIAKKLLEISSKKVFLFYGDLGAGKTSLIKLLCKHLGVEDQVSSPTYALIHEYNATDNLVYHMDLYRLKSEEEAFDIGIEDYLYSDLICLIEWPQKIENIIDVPFHTITITAKEDHSRILVFK